jgi:hypothetical protein
LGHADGVNKTGESIHTVKKDTALVVFGREIGLEANSEKIEYMVVSEPRMLYKMAHKD